MRNLSHRTGGASPTAVVLASILAASGLAPASAAVPPAYAPAIQEAPAERPTHTVASILMTGDWWAPDFSETWSFRPDPEGGVRAQRLRRRGANHLGDSFRFEAALDGRRLTSRYESPPDVVIYDEANGVVLRRPVRPEVHQPSQNIRLQRLRGPAGSRSWTAPFLGRWSTNGGVLTFTESNGFLHGRLERMDAGGAPSLVRRLVFTQLEGDRIIGAWAGPDGFQGAEATINIGPEGDSLHGRLSRQIGSAESWSARRLRPDPVPADPPRPGPEPAPDPHPHTPAPNPSPSQHGEFRALGMFEVRLDRLERPRAGGVVLAAVTIRNVGRTVQHLPSGTFRAILTDADGAGQERNQLWRGSGEPAQLFNGTPALQPGAELTVRFTFNPDVRDLASLVLMRGGDQVVFDLSGL